MKSFRPVPPAARWRASWGVSPSSSFWGWVEFSPGWRSGCAKGSTSCSRFRWRCSSVDSRRRRVATAGYSPPRCGAPGCLILLALILLAASLLLIPTLGSELVPELVQGEFYADLELPPGTRLAVTESYLSRLSRTAAGFDGVATVYSIAGTSNEQGGTAGELRENLGQLTVTLSQPTGRAAEEALMGRLREEFDALEGLSYRFGRPSYFSFKTPVEVEIRGYNLELLKWLSERLVSEMRGIPGLSDVKSSTEGGNPELQIHFDRERLANLGPQSVRHRIDGALEGPG